MKIRLALAGIGIILIIGLIGWYLYNKPHSGISNIDADVTLTAGDLYKQFQEDEVTANKNYLNKVIEVTGEVSEIQNVNDYIIILLSSNDPMGGINCQLSKENDKNITLKKSTTITIKGRCSGYLMDVNLVDCILK